MAAAAHLRRAAAAAAAAARSAGQAATAPARHHHSAGQATAAPISSRPRAFLRHSNPAPITSSGAVSYTPRRDLSLTPALDAHPLEIPAEIRQELSRVELAGISCHRKLAQDVTKLSARVGKESHDMKAKPVEDVIRVGTVAWRVCSSVLAVTVAAGFGTYQIAIDGWETGFQDEACKVAKEKIEEKSKGLEASLLASAQQNKALVRQEKQRVADREAEIAAKEAELAAWEADLAAQE